MTNSFSGPGGTSYRLVAYGPLGRVGAADLGGSTRIRVEPINSVAAVGIAATLAGWNQPTIDNCRFSFVAYGDDIEKKISIARDAVGGELEAPPSTLASCAEAARELAKRLEALRG